MYTYRALHDVLAYEPVIGQRQLYLSFFLGVLVLWYNSMKVDELRDMLNLLCAIKIPDNCQGRGRHL